MTAPSVTAPVHGTGRPATTSTAPSAATSSSTSGAGGCSSMSTLLPRRMDFGAGPWRVTWWACTKARGTESTPCARAMPWPGPSTRSEGTCTRPPTSTTRSETIVTPPASTTTSPVRRSRVTVPPCAHCTGPFMRQWPPMASWAPAGAVARTGPVMVSDAQRAFRGSSMCMGAPASITTASCAPGVPAPPWPPGARLQFAPSCQWPPVPAQYLVAPLAAWPRAAPLFGTAMPNRLARSRVWGVRMARQSNAGQLIIFLWMSSRPHGVMPSTISWVLEPAVRSAEVVRS